MLLEIVAPQLEWWSLAPLIALIVGASIGIVVESFVPRGSRYNAQVIVTLTTLVVALMFVIFNWASGRFGIGAVGSLAFDHPTYLFWTILLVAGVFGLFMFAERALTNGASAFTASAYSVPGSSLEREADEAEFEHTEVYPLLLFSLFGMLIFAAANDTITMFVALEIFSLPLYLLCGLARRRRLLSQEAALKYFLLGALSSGFFLYGVALLYGYSGSFRLGDLDAAIAANQQSQVLLIAGMALMAVGMLFKVGAVPFHSWTPDVYMGAPTPVTAFMAVATKTAAVAALLRLFYVGLGTMRWDWQPVFITIAILTMAVGSIVAISQTDIKRMLAYSSIAHAGFILVGVVGAVTLTMGMGGTTSVGGIAFYLIAYGLGTFGAFALVTMVRKAGGEANALAAWSGLGRSNPVFGAIMTLFMLSFAGIPLTAGFIGKWMVFASAWQGGFGWLVLVAVIMSLVAAYFYLRVVVIMFFREPTADTAEVATAGPFTWTVVAIGVIGTVVLGLVPGPLLELCDAASVFLR